MENIKGFEGYYKATEDGKIFSIRSDRLLKQTNKPNGYMYLELNVGGTTSYHRVHRLIAETFVDNTDNKPFVNHIDGNKSNNRKDNLEWVTGTENNLHAIANGLVKFWHNVYEVTCPLGVEYKCVGYEEVRELTGLSSTTITNCTKANRLTRTGWKIKYLERQTTIPRGSTPK